MCAFLALLFLGPRAAIIVWWIFNPERWMAVFDSVLVAGFGFLLVPWATLMYALVGIGGLEGFDWLWMGLAVAVDLMSYAGGAVGGRGRVPGYGA